MAENNNKLREENIESITSSNNLENNYNKLEIDDLKKTPSYCTIKNGVVNLTKDKTNDLSAIIKEHYKKNRSKAFLALNNLQITTGNSASRYHYPNLEFISNYSKYFYVNDKCLCNIPIEKSIGKGKAGTAYKVSINGNEFIIKIIPKVATMEYLSLRVYDLKKKKFFGINETHIAASPSIEYNSHTFIVDGNTEFTGFIGVAGDYFTNQTCIHMILNEILINKNIRDPNYVYQYDAFYCNDGRDGFNILEWADGGDLSNYIEKNTTIITDDLIKNIITQVLSPLVILKCKKYGFVHADLKCKNIFVKKNSNLEPIFKIADFDKSSIFWKAIRFHAQAVILNISTTSLSNPGYGISDYEGKEYYMLGQGKEGLLSYLPKLLEYIPDQVYIMLTALPMIMSYDIYTFIYSLLREPKIFGLFNAKKLPFLDKILDILFFEDDRIKKIIPHLSEKMMAYVTLKYEVSKYEDNNSGLNFNNIKDMTPEEFKTFVEKELPTYYTNYTEMKNQIKHLSEKKDQLKLNTIESNYKDNNSGLNFNNIKDMTPEKFKTFVENQKGLLPTYYTNYTKMKDLLIKLRSLGSMNKDLKDLEIKLKVNIDAVYKAVGPNSPTDIDEEINKYHEKKQQKKNENKFIKLTNTGSLGAFEKYHICTSECEKGNCNTNTYTYKSTLQHKDTCTEVVSNKK